MNWMTLAEIEAGLRLAPLLATAIALGLLCFLQTPIARVSLAIGGGLAGLSAFFDPDAASAAYASLAAILAILAAGLSGRDSFYVINQRAPRQEAVALGLVATIVASLLLAEFAASPLLRLCLAMINVMSVAALVGAREQANSARAGLALILAAGPGFALAGLSVLFSASGAAPAQAIGAMLALSASLALTYLFPSAGAFARAAADSSPMAGASVLIVGAALTIFMFETTLAAGRALAPQLSRLILQFFTLAAFAGAVIGLVRCYGARTAKVAVAYASVSLAGLAMAQIALLRGLAEEAGVEYRALTVLAGIGAVALFAAAVAQERGGAALPLEWGRTPRHAPAALGLFAGAAIALGGFPVMAPFVALMSVSEAIRRAGHPSFAIASACVSLVAFGAIAMSLFRFAEGALAQTARGREMINRAPVPYTGFAAAILILAAFQLLALRPW